MRATKRTNIAIRVLMYCALHTGRLVTKSEIARRCNASENHLAQVVNQLRQMAFLKTHRGRNGGLELARSADDITLGDVFRAIESPDPINDSFSDFNEACSALTHDRLRAAVRDASESFYASLDGVTLTSLIEDHPRDASDLPQLVAQRPSEAPRLKSLA